MVVLMVLTESFIRNQGEEPIMKRRDFIRKTGQIAAGALITGSLSQCIRRDDIFYPSLDNGITWTNQQQSVDIGSEGTNDATRSSDPTVLKDGSTYKMWYTGDSGGTTLRIIYCESSDGINWSNFQVVINIASSGTGFDSSYVQTPSVIKDGSTYKMWYAGNNGNDRIIYCESSDGINWSNYQLAINLSAQGTYDTVNTFAPAVIKENGVYKMWYTGEVGGFVGRIIYCESTNGVNWFNFQLSINLGSQGVYDTAGCFHASVIRDGSNYKMWYAGDDGTNFRIIYCESSDGISWSNFQLSVNINSQGTLDTINSSQPSVINEYGIGKMWYTGNNGTRRIIYAESR